MVLLPWQTAVITRSPRRPPIPGGSFEIKDSGPLCQARPVRYPRTFLSMISKANACKVILLHPGLMAANTFELVIVLMEGGAGTTYLFKEGNRNGNSFSRAIRAFLPA